MPGPRGQDDYRGELHAHGFEIHSICYRISKKFRSERDGILSSETFGLFAFAVGRGVGDRAIEEFLCKSYFSEIFRSFRLKVFRVIFGEFTFRIIPLFLEFFFSRMSGSMEFDSVLSCPHALLGN